MAGANWGGIDVRATASGVLVLRASIKDLNGARINYGSGTLSILSLEADGSLRTFDFTSKTFITNTGHVATPAVALVHQTYASGTAAGLWTYALTGVENLVYGRTYLSVVNHISGSPANQEREFMWGGAQGDIVVNLANNTGYVASDNYRWFGTHVPTPNTAGYPIVTSKNGTGTGEIVLTSGAINTVGTVNNGNTVQWGGVAVSGAGVPGVNLLFVQGSGVSTTGLIDANIRQYNGTNVPTAYTDGVPVVHVQVGTVSGAIFAVTGAVTTVGNVNAVNDKVNYTITTTQQNTISSGAWSATTRTINGGFVDAVNSGVNLSATGLQATQIAAINSGSWSIPVRQVVLNPTGLPSAVSAQVASGVWVDYTTLGATQANIVKWIFATTAGILSSGAGSTLERFKGPDGVSVVVSLTCDASGNRPSGIYV